MIKTVNYRFFFVTANRRSPTSNLISYRSSKIVVNRFKNIARTTEMTGDTDVDSVLSVILNFCSINQVLLIVWTTISSCRTSIKYVHEVAAIWKENIMSLRICSIDVNSE